MKKILSIMLVIMCMVGLFATVAPVTVNAAEGDVMLVIQCKVDAEIGDRSREVQLTIYNVDTFDMYDVSFFSTSNYRTKVEVPAGTYSVGGLWVAGLNVLEGESYEFTTPTVTAAGQTVNMEVVIGKGDWAGEDDGSVGGFVDRDKTDDLMQEDGKDPVDWDKVDQNVDDFQNDVTKPDDTTDPSNPDVTDPSNPDDPNNPDVDDPSNPNGGEGDNTGDNTGNTGNDDKDKTVNKELVSTVLFIVVVFGGCAAILIYKRVKAGLPILPFGKNDEE